MTRRICAALACLALGLGLLAGCAGQPKTTVSDNAQRFTAYDVDVFDTMTQVIAYCDSQAEFDRQMEALHADLVAYHQLYDIYNDYEGLNNIKTINDNAGVAPVEVDQRIIDMLELAVEMYDTTGGKLNVAMGSVLAVWHDYREAAEADCRESFHGMVPFVSFTASRRRSPRCRGGTSTRPPRRRGGPTWPPRRQGSAVVSWRASHSGM